MALHGSTIRPGNTRRKKLAALWVTCGAMPSISQTVEPVVEPVKPVATPHLDLRRDDERPVFVDIDLKYDHVEAGIRTHTCPQCGLNPGGAVVKKWQYIPPWVYVGLLINILVLLILYSTGKRTVKAELNLCQDCDQADNAAQRLRGLSLGGLFLGPLAAGIVGGVSLGEDGAIVGALTGLVAGIAGIVAAHRRTRFDVIVCRLIDKKKGKVTIRTAGQFRRVLAHEAPDALL